MDFKIDKLDEFTLVQVLKEKMDTHVAPTLKSELVLLSGNGEKHILLDLGKCNYCDSSGLSAIWWPIVCVKMQMVYLFWQVCSRQLSD
jgi:anti-anti-sigma regulatory factor